MENHYFTAFISYRHIERDEIIAKKLHRFIEMYRMPSEVKKSSGRKTIGRVFRDQDELPLSVNLGADIRMALENSDWFIAICSPEYLNSRWCMEELNYFISLGKRDRILTVLTSGEPSEAFPEQLCYIETDEGRLPVEPLAADIRADSVGNSLKKLKSEKLRLLAPILNVSYDTLYRRERKRQIKSVLAFFAVVIVLLVTFLTYTIIKNKEISMQRDIAISNQMQMIIEQANMSVGVGNKATAKKLLSKAAELRDNIGSINDDMLYNALELAIYTNSFEVMQIIKTNNCELGTPGFPNSVVFSHSGQYLLGITNRNTAVLFDTESGEILHSVSKSNYGDLHSVGFTKDDKFFFTLNASEGRIFLYKTETGELYRGGSWGEPVGSKIFPIDNNRIIIPMADVLCIWNYEKDYASDAYEFVLPMEHMSNEPYIDPLIMDVSPSGDLVAVGQKSGPKILSIDGKQELVLEHDADRRYYPIRFSGDGKYIVAGSDFMYFVWSVETGERVASGETDFDWIHGNVKLNYDGSVLIIMGPKYLGAVEVITGELLWEKRSEDDRDAEAVISPNGKYVASLGGIAGIFDIKTGEELSDRPCNAFSSDGKKVLCDGYSSSPSLLVTPEYATANLVSNYNGKIFSAHRKKEPSMYDILQGTHTTYEIPPYDEDYFGTVYVDPKGKYAAKTHCVGYIEVFDISNSGSTKEICCIAEHYNYFGGDKDVVFNGDLMATSGGYDDRCTIFDLASGTMLHVLNGEDYLHKSEFSKDGSEIILLSGMDKTSAFVYSVRSGNLLYRIDAPQGTQITDVGFDEKDGSAVVIFNDGRATVGEIYGSLDEMIKKTRE